jgi:hypothetical protein
MSRASILKTTVIWHRYQSMLLANSIILGLVSRGHTSKWVSLFGLLLCLAWAWLTWRGWTVQNLRMLRVRKEFEWSCFTNPMDEQFQADGIRTGAFDSYYLVRNSLRRAWAEA